MNEELIVLELEKAHGPIIKNHEFANYSSLKKIDLPKGIEIIEDYAFYRCTELEEIHLYEGIHRLGCGAFMGCKKLKKIVVKDVETDIHFLTEMLYDFQYEITIELYYRDGSFAKLVFPEYYEEAVENTPARIIDVVFHGSGYKYRQCFRNRQLDYEKYDSLFSYAIAQEFSSTCISMALCRLCAPYQLKESAKNRYLTFLQEKGAELADMLCREDRLDEIEALGMQGFFTKELLEVFQQRAALSGHAEVVSYLLDYKMKHFPPTKKTFSFEF